MSVNLEDLSVNDPNLERIISKNWLNGLLYQGVNVFDVYIDDSTQSVFEHELYIGRGNDGQETYLGYCPSEDVFITGWDLWPEDSPTECGIVIFKVNGFKISVIKTIESFFRDSFYLKGYRRLHREYPDIIDVRLD